MSESGRSRHRGDVSKKLARNIRLYSLLALVFLVLFVSHLARLDHRAPLWAIGSLIAGYAIGSLLTRGQDIRRDTDTSTIVTSTTTFGAIMLVLYIAFLISKTWFIEDILGINDTELAAAIGTGISAGVMIGRVINTRKGIRDVTEAFGIR